MRMVGKIGLVTAAGSGMGRAGAIRFAQEGGSIGVVDISLPFLGHTLIPQEIERI